MCDGCELDFEDLIRNVGKSDEKAIEIFERHNIIPVTLDCPKCFCCSTYHFFGQFKGSLNEFCINIL